MHPVQIAMMIDRADRLSEGCVATATEAAQGAANELAARGDTHRARHLLSETEKNLVAARRATSTAHALRNARKPPTWEINFEAFGFLFRDSDPCPLPETVKRCRDFGREPFNWKAPVKVSCGDFVVFASRNDWEGLELRLHRVGPDGNLEYCPCGRGFKVDLKSSIGMALCSVDPRILKGAGPAAAAVRRIHAERAGFVSTAEREAENRAQAEKFIGATKEAIEPILIDGDEAAILAGLD